MKYTLVFFFVLFMGTSCAPVKKNKANFKTRKFSCSLADLVGHDAYYYSDHYKRKLKRSIKRIGRK